MDTYALCARVFACRCGEHVVLMNLDRNRYYALPASALDWNFGSRTVRRASGLSAGGEAVIERLAKLRLIEPRARLAPSTQIAIPMPKVSLLESASSVERLTLRAFLNFVHATFRARALLRFRSFGRTVEKLGGQPSSHQQATASPPHAELITQFNALQSLCFVARDACLKTSLALLLFLRAYGYSPVWVFGVRTAPFRAHCWLQIGNTLLNETVEGAAPYVPILIIGPEQA